MKFLKTHKKYIAFVVLMITAGIVSAVVYGKITARTAGAPPEFFDVQIHKDKVFPDTDLASFGSNLDLNEELKQGKVLVVYMQTGCAGCKLEADLLAKSNLFEEFGIKIYLVGYEGYEDWVKFKQDHKINFPVFYDKDHALRKKLGVDVFPNNFFVNDGKIERSWRGILLRETVDDLYKKLGLTKKSSYAQ